MEDVLTELADYDLRSNQPFYFLLNFLYNAITAFPAVITFDRTVTL